uniref:magnesium chelatase n=1 Tax=Lotharella globosa TaxID=91324 RepID=A0A6V3M3M8_9EUKA|mmetsp:Transcript_7679/g.14261  ORF Transcript_7679/g.14261 Transcript_7679/m.14261 type:complete len:406 (+) Transcript_7679:57-1274(+)
MDKRIPSLKNYKECPDLLHTLFTMFTHASGHFLIDTTEMKSDTNSNANCEALGLVVDKMFAMAFCTIQCTCNTTPQDIINTASIQIEEDDTKTHTSAKSLRETHGGSLTARNAGRTRSVVPRDHRNARGPPRPSEPKPFVRVSVSDNMKPQHRHQPSSKNSFIPRTTAINREIKSLADYQQNQTQLQRNTIAQINSGSGERQGGFSTVWIITDLHLAPHYTQLYVLQAMARRIIHVDNRAHQLPEFFRVIATRQTDRGGLLPRLADHFLLETEGYKVFDQVSKFLVHHQQSKRHRIVDMQHIVDLRFYDKSVPIDLELQGFVRDIVTALRHDSRVRMGPSPTASRNVMDVLKIRALLSAQDFVKPHDIPAAATDVLSHRMVLRPGVSKVREIVMRMAAKTQMPPK